MDPADEKAFKELSKTVKENNKLLHKIHNSMLIGRVLRIMYFVIIIGSMVGVYFYIPPLVEGIVDSYSNFFLKIQTLFEKFGIGGE
jgi:hypothetical protein